MSDCLDQDLHTIILYNILPIISYVFLRQLHKDRIYIGHKQQKPLQSLENDCFAGSLSMVAVACFSQII